MATYGKWCKKASVVTALILAGTAYANTALDREMMEFRREVLTECALREEAGNIIMDKTCMAKKAEKKLQQLCHDYPIEFKGKCEKSALSDLTH